MPRNLYRFDEKSKNCIKHRGKVFNYKHFVTILAPTIDAKDIV
jgi:hypothetical protein